MMSFAIFTVFSVIFIGLLTAKRDRRFSPVRVWMLMWSVSWLINWLVGGPFYFSTEVTLIVFLGVLSYVLGASIMWAAVPRNTKFNTAKTAYLNHEIKQSKFLHILLVGFFCVAVLLLELGSRNISGASLISVLTSGRSGMFEVMRANQAALYSDDGANFPFEFKLVTLILTTAPVFICYRMSFAKQGTSSIMSLALLVLLSIVFSAVTGVRSLLLVPLIIGFFSFYTGCVLNNRTNILFNVRTITAVVALIVGFISWVVLVQSARLGDLNFSRVSATLEHMRPWVAGYVPALSVWFDQQYDSSDLGLGRVFARALLGPMGLVSGEGFNERIDSVVIGNWQVSNAMTIFRVFIQDFGAVGAILFCGVLGFLGELVYINAFRRGGIWIVLLISVYCSVFFAINFWFFFYGARVMGIIGAIILMGYLGYRARRRMKMIRHISGPSTR